VIKDGHHRPLASRQFIPSTPLPEERRWDVVSKLHLPAHLVDVCCCLLQIFHPFNPREPPVAAPAQYLDPECVNYLWSSRTEPSAATIIGKGPNELDARTVVQAVVGASGILVGVLPVFAPLGVANLPELLGALTPCRVVLTSTVQKVLNGARSDS
jgi:hypothetical protein